MFDTFGGPEVLLGPALLAWRWRAVPPFVEPRLRQPERPAGKRVGYIVDDPLEDLL